MCSNVLGRHRTLFSGVCKEMKYDVYVNYDLIHRVRKSREDELLRDDSYKTEADTLEDINLTQMYEQSKAYTDLQTAVCLWGALDTRPLLVFQIIAEYFIEKTGKKRGTENDESN